MNTRLYTVFALALLTAACTDSDNEGPSGYDGSSTARDLSSRDRSERDTGRDLAVQDYGLTDTDSQDTDSSSLDLAIGDRGDDQSEDSGFLELSCFTDEDNDGRYAEECGGDDCDDSVYAVNPGVNEFCDAYDNDCNDTINDGLVCNFYAHTATDLYRVDPFLGTTTRVGVIPTELWDIDTHPDGTLYGVNATALYRLEEASGTWSEVGSLDHFSGAANGMAIDMDGIAYMTAGNSLYTINLTNGDATLVGPMGGGFESSGDCVVNKDNTLLMSSKHTSSTDTLIRIDGETGVGTSVGPIGASSVFGLTAAWGTLYGVTSGGLLISINESTGAGTPIHEFDDFRFYGAASTANR